MPGLLCVCVVAAFDVTQLLGDGLPPFLAAIALFCAAAPPFTYLASFLFSSHSTAQNLMLFAYFLSGYGLLVAALVPPPPRHTQHYHPKPRPYHTTQPPNQTSTPTHPNHTTLQVMDIVPSLQAPNKWLKFVYRLFPNYSFAEAMCNLILRTSDNQYGPAQGRWSLEVVGWPCIYMACESIVYMMLVLAVEHVRADSSLLQRCSRRPPPAVLAQIASDANGSEGDADVVNEQRRIAAMAVAGDGEDTIALKNLVKVYYPDKVAVQGLSFGVPAGQCFGFLGVNGAGKTSTLKMLSADILPTRGTATIKGLDLLKDQKRVREHLGYCPQFDAQTPTLTSRETLTLYARIKGVPERRIPDFVRGLVHSLGLRKYMDIPCGTYSGGNKRKLSVAMALIGNPSVVFLDEPSSGMDPKARRDMWKVIERSMKNRSVILTTHSMAEAEALCSRIGILNAGQLRCLGSPAHLKETYGDGWQLDIALGVPAPAQPPSPSSSSAVPTPASPPPAPFYQQEVAAAGDAETQASQFMVEAAQAVKEWLDATFGVRCVLLLVLSCLDRTKFAHTTLSVFGTPSFHCGCRNVMSLKRVKDDSNSKFPTTELLSVTPSFLFIFSFAFHCLPVKATGHVFSGP